MRAHATLARPHAPLFAAVFERRHCAELLLRGTRQEQPALVALVELVRGNSNVMRAYAEKATGADDAVGNIPLRSDDDILHLPDLLTLVIVHVLAEQLTPHAPALYHVVQLGNGYTELGFSGGLRLCTHRSRGN